MQRGKQPWVPRLWCHGATDNVEGRPLLLPDQSADLQFSRKFDSEVQYEICALRIKSEFDREEIRAISSPRTMFEP
jgi:hypothetical protein